MRSAQGLLCKPWVMWQVRKMSDGSPKWRNSRHCAGCLANVDAQLTGFQLHIDALIACRAAANDRQHFCYDSKTFGPLSIWMTSETLELWRISLITRREDELFARCRALRAIEHFGVEATLASWPKISRRKNAGCFCGQRGDGLGGIDYSKKTTLWLYVCIVPKCLVHAFCRLVFWKTCLLMSSLF